MRSFFYAPQKKLHSWESHSKDIIMYLRAKKFHYINRRRPKIFLYTDSRGYDISVKHFTKDLFSFYPGYLIKNFCVDYFICPEKHTTIMDFLRTYELSTKNYDYVIAHVGIVDFSPRHQSVAQSIYNLKKDMYDKVFSEQAMQEYLNTDLDVEYENEKTINMYSLEMTSRSLIPCLLKIPNLIWIGCNKFAKNWEGNYFRSRPKNISLVENYSALLCKALPQVVCFSDWDDNLVMQNTYDNIHLTKQGGEILLSRILTEIRENENAMDK